MVCSNQKCVAGAALAATIVGVLLLVIVAIVGDHQSNDVQNNLAQLAATSMITDLPGQGCIPNVSNLVDGSFCQPLSTGCMAGPPIDYDFVNPASAIPMWSSLIQCNVINIIHVHDETGILTSNNALDIISDFYNTYAIDGEPIVYSVSNLQAKAHNYPPLLLNNVIVRLSSTDGYNYIWMNMMQNNNTMICLNATLTLNSTTNYDCAGAYWYLTVPYCRTYSCTNGIDLQYYATYANYIAVASGSFKGTLYGYSLSLSNINAVYSGIIGALVAMIVGVIVSIATFFSTS